MRKIFEPGHVARHIPCADAQIQIVRPDSHDIFSDPKASIAPLFADMEPISLEQTNAKAQMLSRIDNKYVVDVNELQNFVSSIYEHYSVLEIEQRRHFTYASCYYDDNYKCFHEHHQGRRQRFKVRTREYVDGGGMKYFEIKLKGLRQKTIKKRMRCDFLVKPEIDGEALAMLKQVYFSQYKKPMTLVLHPALMVGYKRCTLVAKQGAERVTIDYRMNFSVPTAGSQAMEIGNGFIIVETKSADGKGIADRVLKKQCIRQASKCSKYCIGVAMTKSVRKNNLFRPTLQRITQAVLAP